MIFIAVVHYVTAGTVKYFSKSPWELVSWDFPKRQDNLYISPNGLSCPYLSLSSGGHHPGFSQLDLAPFGHPRKDLSALKIAIFHLKYLKLMPTGIGVVLMGPSHCLNIDGYSYLVLQLLYHWWLPILGLQLMECCTKAPGLRKYFAFCESTGLLIGKWHR
jgi:hypothetical protein